MNINNIRWFHKITLDDGRVTPGIVDIAKHETLYLFDQLDFQGKSVLDIGCWDGYFSFMAEKRGARRVLSLDDPDFRWGDLYGYNFLHDYYKSQAEWRKGSIFNLPDERFDIVLCYGVLYHVNDPLSAMIDSFHVALDEIIFEGVFFDNKEPLLWLFAPKECHNDPSNIYALSTGYLIKVAGLCGFELVEIKWPRYAATRWRRWKRKVRPGYDRATLRFRRVSEIKPGFKKECFSLVPNALKMP